MRHYTRDYPTSYAEADEYLSHARNGRERTLAGKATTLCRCYDGNAIHLYYHQTPIVTFYADGSILLDNGGWPTISTHTKMNNALFGSDWLVYSEHSITHVRNNRTRNTYSLGTGRPLLLSADGLSATNIAR